MLKCGPAHNNTAKREGFYTAGPTQNQAQHSENRTSLHNRHWDESPQPSVIANRDAAIPGVKSHTLRAVTAPEYSRW